MLPANDNLYIEDLHLSIRAYNCLKRSGLTTVGLVLKSQPAELRNIRNFGLNSYRELRSALIARGYPDIGPAPDEPEEPGETPPDDRPPWGGPESGDRFPRKPLPGGLSAGAAAEPESPEEERFGTLGDALMNALRGLNTVDEPESGNSETRAG
jgi:DNA-directed RNA polymerase subunit alpha